MTRDDMFQVAKDFCSDMAVQLEGMAPRVFYYGTVQDCLNYGGESVHVVSNALGVDMESWAEDISSGFVRNPDFEGFFVVLSILEVGTDRDLMLISEQTGDGGMRTFTVDLEGYCVDSEYPDPTCLENIDLVVH